MRELKIGPQANPNPPGSRQKASLRQSILSGTADDSYSMYGSDDNMTTNVKNVTDAKKGTTREVTSISHNNNPKAVGTVSEGGTNVQGNYAGSHGIGGIKYGDESNRKLADYKGTLPANRRYGFQETYSDGDFVRNTKSGTISSRVPKGGELNTPTQIAKYKKHKTDSTFNKFNRELYQVDNRVAKKEGEVLTKLIERKNKK